MHISALQTPHSSHGDVKISPLWPYFWKRTNTPGPWAASFCCPLQGDMPGREQRLTRESVANPRWGFPSSLAACLLRFFTARFVGFSPFLFLGPELGLMWIHSTVG